MSSSSNFRFQVNRPGFSQKELENNYTFNKYKSDNAWIGFKNYVIKYYTPSQGCFKEYITNRLSIIRLFKTYDIRKNLLKDFIGGLTIGVVQIPQSK
jgi:hypothetical protein